MKKVVCWICNKGGENGPLIKEIVGYPFPFETGEYVHEKCSSPEKERGNRC